MSGVNDNYKESEKDFKDSGNWSPKAEPEGIDRNKNFQELLAKASTFKRSFNDFLGWEEGKFSEKKNPSGSPSSDLSWKETVKRLTVLEDKVSDLDGDLFLKHQHLELSTKHTSGELTRGLAYVKEFVVYKTKGWTEKLKEEIAKNEGKDTALKELLQRVEALETRSALEKVAGN